MKFVLNRSVTMDILLLFWVQWKVFHFWPLSMILAIGFKNICPLSHWGSYVRVFNHECVLNFVICPKCIYWNHHITFLILLIWCITLIFLNVQLIFNSGKAPADHEVLSFLYNFIFDLLIFGWGYFNLFTWR